MGDQVYRRSCNRKDPTMDFLFEYYGLRPSHFKRWSPGFGSLMEGEDFRTFFPSEKFEKHTSGFGLTPATLPYHRYSAFRWIRSLLTVSLKRAPFFGCFGMHEWAMVYRLSPEEVRHSQFPLRMNPDELAAFVESRPVVCSHFDAYRFFTEAAQPLNRLRPTRLTMEHYEQPGCLHTNMDLYKWAFKGMPWVPSELVMRAFDVACDARRLDMCASPYDVREMGMEPIFVETEEGREEYVQKQKELFEAARPIREELVSWYDTIVNALEHFAPTYAPKMEIRQLPVINPAWPPTESSLRPESPTPRS